MRVVTVIAVLLLGGAATLEAQHRFQFEVGGFASFTRFDRAFLLDNQIGGGGRLGFWITDWLGIEGDGLYMRPHPKGGGTGTDFPVWFGSGSLVLNFGSEKSFYILGGYSAMDFNSNGGGFRDAGAHGAIGDRIYISDRAALRLEARAYFAPNTQFPGTSKWAGQLVGSAGLSFFLGPSHRESAYPEVPKQKRDSILAAGGKVPEARPTGGPSYESRSSDWQHKWYWGGEAGILIFRTNFDSYDVRRALADHGETDGVVRVVRAVTLHLAPPCDHCRAQRGGHAGQRPVRQFAPHHGRCARLPSAAPSGAVRGRWVRHHGSVECPGELRELYGLGLGPAPRRGRPGGDQGLFLVDGRGRHQARSAGAVRPLHPDIGGGQLPDPRHHPHLPGRRPLLLG